MIVTFDDWYKQQAMLDQVIFDKHNLVRTDTQQDRLLALLVELGELANETRCFKFWSVTPASSKEVIAGEFVDGIHFFLSIGIDLMDDSECIQSVEVDGDLSAQFLAVYEAVVYLRQEINQARYIHAFSLFLGIADKLKLDQEQIKQSYDLKNKKNHQRQENNY